jgi:hypothetical protein
VKIDDGRLGTLRGAGRLVQVGCTVGSARKYVAHYTVFVVSLHVYDVITRL